MKLLLLGATGRTGQLVLKRLLENRFPVHCLARNTERIAKQDGVTLFEGDASNREDLERAIVGCDAVISVLNISRQSDFPWSGLRTPKAFLSETMKQLIPVAEFNCTKRLVVCSAWGVAETRKDLPRWFRWLIDTSNIGASYADHERQERIIQDSTLDWTIVRPVGLTNSRKSQVVREIFDGKHKPRLTINRHSVAQYLVDCLKSDRLIRKKVVISKD
ncbi:NAD(P)-binding oxidoreductase [Ekhidna sp.]|uniref:NAD(P)-dependent oxidoreductase n=1 Tax=Ekhidna sp. TaxID=2608089 RepID=UPI0032985F44